MFDERFREIPGAETWEAPKTEPKPTEEEETAASEESLEEVIALYEDLEPDEQRKVTDRALDKMRGVLSGIDDYAVFASTAMYLNGKRMKALGEAGTDVEALMAAPGDLDVAVASDKSLRLIQERLARRPDVLLDNGGKIRYLSSSGDARVLSGKLFVKTEQGEVGYDFEFFNESQIVKDDVLRNKRQIEGLQVLTLEGLQGQYLNNLSMETQIDTKVRGVADYLTGASLETARKKAEEEQKELVLPEGWVDPGELRNAVATGDLTKEMEAILQRLELSADDLKTFYEIQDQIDEEDNEKKRQDLISKRAIVLSGLKTKIPKRQKNTDELARLRFGRTDPGTPANDQK